VNHRLDQDHDTADKQNPAGGQRFTLKTPQSPATMAISTAVPIVSRTSATNMPR
jgi:hypothetical protein